MPLHHQKQGRIEHRFRGISEISVRRTRLNVARAADVILVLRHDKCWYSLWSQTLQRSGNRVSNQFTEQREVDTAYSHALGDPIYIHEQRPRL